MFLLIYKCRIAVSMRGKWFWKAWHCKLSLSDRLSVAADQKTPQSMMSDRQANSPGGQALLHHFPTTGTPGMMLLWKGSKDLCGGGGERGGGLTFRGLLALVQKMYGISMVDEIWTNLVGLTGKHHWNEDVTLYHWSALWEHGSQTLKPCVCD